jgi:hypothetical protein
LQTNIHAVLTGDEDWQSDDNDLSKIEDFKDVVVPAMQDYDEVRRQKTKPSAPEKAYCKLYLLEGKTS